MDNQGKPAISARDGAVEDDVFELYYSFALLTGKKVNDTISILTGVLMNHHNSSVPVTIMIN